jgi:hypothetical protein
VYNLCFCIENNKKYVGRYRYIQYVIFYVPEANVDWRFRDEPIVSKKVEAVNVATFARHSPDLKYYLQVQNF